MTIKSIVTKPLMCCAVAFAPVLWASTASAEDVTLTLFHDSENPNLCLNDPRQSTSDGTQLVFNEHCDYNDIASAVHVAKDRDGYVVLSVHVNDFAPFGNPYRCVDNRYGAQENFNPIVIWTCNGGETQKWELTSAGELRYHPNPAYCASVHTDGKLYLYECLGQGNQKFVTTVKAEKNPFDALKGHTISGPRGDYIIFPKGDNRACDNWRAMWGGQVICH